MCTNFNVNYILVGNMPRPQTPEFNIIRKYDIPLHLSDPVWPPDMILVSIMGKIPDVRRKSKGFDLVFQDLYLLGVYCPVFGKIRGWKTKQGKKSDFSDTQQVRTTRCTLLFFWGGSKVNYNICIFDISPSLKSKSRYKVSHAATEATQRVFRTRVRG